MKALGFLLSIIIMIAAFAATAMAAGGDVNLTVDGGTSTLYSLDSMSIAQDGTITLSISSTNPTGLTIGCTPSNYSGQIQNVYFSQSATMTASGGTQPYTFSCTGTGPAGITTTLSGNICTVSGTPTATGTYHVTMSVTDGTNTTASHDMPFGVTAPGTCAPVTGGTDPSSPVCLNYNDPNTNWTTFPIGPGGNKYFKAVQASQCTSGYKQMTFGIVYQQTAPNLNFIVYKSNGGSVPSAANMYNEYVTMLQKYGYDAANHIDGSYYFKFIGTQSGSGETTYVPSTFNQADTYYILVVNTSTSKSTTFDMRYYCR